MNVALAPLMTPVSNPFLRFIVLLVLASVPAWLFAAGNDTLIPAGQNYLEMRGRVLRSVGEQGGNMPLDSAVVQVLDEAGKPMWHGVTDTKGHLNLRLPLGKKFTMSFTKKGYVKKLISVDTHVTGDPKKNFEFAYDIDIFESVEGLDVTVLNSPVAKIVYRSYDKTFTYDAAYTNKINVALQKMYREYYTIGQREKHFATSDSVATKSSATRSAATKKSVPYGQGKKPH
jgi:hypothetical protein